MIPNGGAFLTPQTYGPELRLEPLPLPVAQTGLFKAPGFARVKTFSNLTLYGGKVYHAGRGVRLAGFTPADQPAAGEVAYAKRYFPLGCTLAFFVAGNNYRNMPFRFL